MENVLLKKISHIAYKQENQHACPSFYYYMNPIYIHNPDYPPDIIIYMFYETSKCCLGRQVASVYVTEWYLN